MSANNNVLVFIDWYLPGYRGGGPIRSVSNMLGKLKSQFNFSIVTRDADYCHPVSYANVNSDAWTESPDGFRCYYFSPKKLGLFELIKLAREQNCDVFYVNGLYSFYFSIVPLLISRLFNYPSVVAPRGMLSTGSMGTRYYRKRIYLVLARYFGVFKNTVFHATSKQEVEDIKLHFGSSAKIKHAPNLPGDLVEAKCKSSKSKGKIKLVSIARVSPEKNIAFGLDVLNDVKGQVELDLYGSVYDESYWKKCLSIMDNLPNNICVNYRDSIEPGKIREALLGGDFLLLPSTGENFGHIIFESFAVGTPVIISDQTPWRNLDKEKIGWDIPLSNKEKFINTIEYVIGMDNGEYEEMSKNAINYAVEFTDNPKSVKLIHDIFELS